MASAKNHQVANQNKPISIRELLTALQEIGVEVRGKNPGTTLAAILKGRSDFEMVDRESRLWCLTSAVFETEAAGQDAVCGQASAISADAQP